MGRARRRCAPEPDPARPGGWDVTSPSARPLSCPRMTSVRTPARGPCGDSRDFKRGRADSALTSLLTGKSRLAYKWGVEHDHSLFKALSDPTRRLVLDELTEQNHQTLFEIHSRLIMKHGLTSSRQAISQHLAVLEEAGLVHTRRQGRYKFHDLDTRPLAAITQRWPIAPQEPNP